MEPTSGAWAQALATATLPPREIVLRLVVALGCGALIGIDREFHDKAMGWRTHMLISLGAASFSILVIEMVRTFDAAQVQMDPTRVIEGIVAGIGFLGAGAIIQGRHKVHGATTGAAIWVVGAIGMAAGLGYYVHAVIITGFTVLVLTIFGFLAKAIGIKEEPDDKDRSGPAKEIE